MSQANSSPTPSLEITGSCQFSAWLAEQTPSLVFTTYQTAKVFFIGLQSNVTAVSQSNVAERWRDKRKNGDCVIDFSSNKVILSGLSMPHSPLWYQDKLGLLNSGTGKLGYADLKQGAFEPIAFCPSYLRGMAFHGNFAVVGLSKPRQNRTFSGLPWAIKLQANGVATRCGLQVIDLSSGDIVHWLRIEGVVEEQYDRVVLPGVRRPLASGFKTDEIRRTVTIGFL